MQRSASRNKKCEKKYTYIKWTRGADCLFVFRRLHVGFDERGEDAVFLLQEVLGRVVLQDIAALHDDDQVGRENGVDAVLQTQRQPQR